MKSFNGQNLFLLPQTGQTALHLAVRHGRVVMVRLLLSCGADANIQDNQGMTSLMFASERGHTHIARLLLERSQCDLTLTDKVRLQPTAKSSSGSSQSTALSAVRAPDFNDNMPPVRLLDRLLRSRSHRQEGNRLQVSSISSLIRPFTGFLPA